MVGRSIDDACGRIENALFDCIRRPTVDAPDGTASGTVLGQEPAAGEQPVGTPVTLTYYEVEPVGVPDVRGSRVQQGLGFQEGLACQAIVAGTFTCTADPIPAAGGQPADEVLRQDPAAGTDHEPGEAVTITYATDTLVPSVVGQQADAACAAIVALNLVCTPQVGAPGAAAGQVTAQDLPTDSPVPADTPVVVTYSPGLPVVPSVVGRSPTEACAALQGQRLICSPEINPTNSINNPGLVDAQSIAPGTTVAADTIVSVYRPAGPDATVHQFRAFDGNTPLEQWAIGTDAGGGREAYDILLGRSGDWHHEETVGRCYTTQVAGSIPLHAFRENSPDPAHEDHFYAASAEQYQRGVDHLGASRGVFCYVVPSGAAGATPVAEWWKGRSHYYHLGFPTQPPGAGYQDEVPQWATW